MAKVSNPSPALILKRVAKKLNEVAAFRGAGFYGSQATLSGRYFKARINAGKLEVWDFDVWLEVPQGAKFHNFDGRDIPLVWG